MNDRAVLSRTADRLKALPQITLLFPAEGIKLLSGTDLSDLSLSDILLKPAHEPCNGSAVLDVGVDDVLKLCVILHRLHQNFRIHLLDDLGFFRDVIIKCIIQPGRIHQYAVFRA